MAGEVPIELVALPRFGLVREYTPEHALYLRASALSALGREREALRWFQTAFQGRPQEMVFGPWQGIPG